MHEDKGARHQGADKAKGMDATKRQQRIRRWVPGMDRAEERRVSTGRACQGGVESRARDTRNPMKTPEELWPRRDTDHRGLTQGGHHIIGISNGHTRYPRRQRSRAQGPGTTARTLSRCTAGTVAPRGTTATRERPATAKTGTGSRGTSPTGAASTSTTRALRTPR